MSRIESALYASREGLTTHGQAIAVISDNISNVSTTGYKAARAEFSDLMAYADGMKDNEVLLTGSGSRISSIRTIQVSGDSDVTGRSLDVAIGGDGYFILGSEDNPLYTRAGNFQLNKEGYLVTTDGEFVLGIPATTSTGGTGDGTTTEVPLDKINLTELSSSAKATSKVLLGGNLSSESKIATPPTNPTSFLQIGRAASAVSTLEVYDSQGGLHGVTLGFYRTDKNTWTVQAYMDSGELGGTAGTPVLLGSKEKIVFEPDGSLSDANKAAAVLTAAGTSSYNNGASAPSFSVDLSEYTQTANPSELRKSTQDGLSTGSIRSYSIGKDGVISAILSNGVNVQVATLQLKQFTNNDGLQRVGGNTYKESTTTGEATKGTPGTKGLGILNGGSLERSTTDMASQFVDLVVFQRGYQANSQMLNATSQMLRDTINLMR